MRVQAIHPVHVALAILVLQPALRHVIAAAAVLSPDVTNCCDDAGVRGRSRVEQVHCRRF